MATAISPTAGRRYGVARVCEVWDLPRSSFYAARQPAAAPAAPARRRGPKPVVSDEALLAAIRADLARSPWTGEGHRKVWARLRVIDRIRVARKRVLRVMREAEGILFDLFARYQTSPGDLPAEWVEGTESEGEGERARRIGNFIAGMTDRFALMEHQRLFDSTPDLR